MTYETRQAYAEICAVLQYMPNEYVIKIPGKIIKLFQTEKIEIQEETQALVEYKEKSFIQRIFDKIKKFFKKN